MPTRQPNQLTAADLGRRSGLTYELSREIFCSRYCSRLDFLVVAVTRNQNVDRHIFCQAGEMHADPDVAFSSRRLIGLDARNNPHFCSSDCCGEIAQPKDFFKPIVYARRLIFKARLFSRTSATVRPTKLAIWA